MQTITKEAAELYAERIREELDQDSIKRFSVALIGRKLQATYNGFELTLSLPARVEDPATIEKYGRMAGKAFLTLWETQTEDF